MQPTTIKKTHFKSLLTPRKNESHKGSYGHLLLVGGSPNRLGAPLMAARAALRSGAGLVTLALPERCYQKIPRGLLEVMYEPLPSGRTGRVAASAIQSIPSLLKGKEVVAIGPGLGVTAEVRQLVVEFIRKTTVPLLLDADGLNVLKDPTVLKKRLKPTILTPHPGEMGRLVNRTTTEVQANRLEIARQFSRETQTILVLKGFQTLVVTPDRQCFLNPTGNPGMATAGMGDVLTGMLGALIAGNPDRILEAILAAVYIHGLAGDRMRNRLGDRGLLASDVIEEIPLAFKELVFG